VVPSLPRAWLHQGFIAPFAGYALPAIALGLLCGGSAIVAFVALFIRPQVGAMGAVIAGAIMVAFGLMEIAVVGFTPLRYPPQFPAWLQVIYLVLGTSLIFLGLRMWKSHNSPGVNAGTSRPKPGRVAPRPNERTPR